MDLTSTFRPFHNLTLQIVMHLPYSVGLGLGCCRFNLLHYTFYNIPSHKTAFSYFLRLFFEFFEIICAVLNFTRPIQMHSKTGVVWSLIV